MINIPKISVVIITYNQEDLISRALDSLLIQKEWLYEIIVCDDCSTDSNWKVVKTYEKRFQGLIKPFRNEINLGIFGNIESTWSKPTGDIVFYLAGDDEYCKGIFEEAIKLINKNNIDFANDSFCLCFDHLRIFPDLKSEVYSNQLITKCKNAISLKVRGLLSIRGMGISNNILKKFTPVKKDLGIYTDNLQDIQYVMFANNFYYSSFVGSVYYVEIGIAKKTLGIEHYKSKILVNQELEKMVNLSTKDKNYLRFFENRILLSYNPTIRQILITIKYYILSSDLKNGIKGMQLNLICKRFWRLISESIKNKNNN